MTYSKRELKSHCNHIVSYGHNWGLTHLREQLRWREQWLRENKLDIRQYKAEIKAYKKAIKNFLITKQKEGSQ